MSSIDDRTIGYGHKKTWPRPISILAQYFERPLLTGAKSYKNCKLKMYSYGEWGLQSSSGSFGKIKSDIAAEERNSVAISYNFHVYLLHSI